jgi:hypothetical protein
MPQDKRKLTQAEAGMAKSLSKLKTPLTAKEKQQTVVQRAKLLQENKSLNAKKGFAIVGKDMTKVPSVAKKMMEKKAANIAMKKSMNEPTSSKRVVGKFLKTSEVVRKNTSGAPYSSSLIRDSRTKNVIGKMEKALGGVPKRTNAMSFTSKVVSKKK